MSLENLDERTRDELASLALRLSSNKKTRKDFLKLAKQEAPNMPIPELDQEAELDTRMKAEAEERQKLASEFADYKAKAEFKDQRSRVMQEYSYSEDQMTQMEEMIKKGELPADYNWASKLFKQQIEPVGGTNYGSDWGPAELPAHEGLLENPDRWAQSTAHAMIDDMRSKGHLPQR